MATHTHRKKTVLVRVLAISLAIITTITLLPGRANASACAAPATDYGVVTSTISVPATATYRTWSRLMAPDTTNNTYALEIDGQSCYVVGGALPTSTWTWVDYQNGTTSSKVQLSLSQGAHTVKMIGLQPNVKLDRLVFASDLNCVPTGLGDTCNTPTDTTPPTVNLTSPAEGADVSGTTAVSADASDSNGIAKVEFYVNGSLQNTDTSAPYGLSLNTANLANNTYSLTAKAYDNAGNFASDTNSMTVKNGDVQPPTTPTSVVAAATAYNKVSLTWKASTDAVGVTGYSITRNGAPLAQVGAVTSYQDTTSASTAYSYQIVAFDAAGNKSAQSKVTTITTPSVPDAQAPSVPTNLQASAVSATQINLSWQASTDNIGVNGYDVYRAIGTGSAQKVSSVSSTSFGDTNLSATTKYSYYIRAHDAAGNFSQLSTTVAATTQAVPVQTKALITGTVRNSKGTPIAQAKVIVQIHGKRATFTTNSKGNYTTNILAGGTYNVTYRAKNYRSQSLTVRITADTTTIKNVTLQKK